MTDEHDICNPAAEARRQNRSAAAALIVAVVIVAAGCWIERNDLMRGVNARMRSAQDLAWGAGCVAADGPYVPEFVAIVKDQFPDRDSVRPIETFHFEPDAPERKLHRMLFGATDATATIEMKFAARDKNGVMQFFHASGELDPKTCIADLFTITDDEGHTDFIKQPKSPPDTCFSNP